MKIQQCTTIPKIKGTGSRQRARKPAYQKAIEALSLLKPGEVLRFEMEKGDPDTKSFVTNIRCAQRKQKGFLKGVRVFEREGTAYAVREAAGRPGLSRWHELTNTITAKEVY